MDEKQLKALWESMSATHELGNFDAFKKNIYSDSNFRKGFWEEAAPQYEIGDYKTFDESFKKKVTPLQPSPSSAIPSLSQTIEKGYDLKSQFQPQGENVNVQRNVFADYENVLGKRASLYKAESNAAQNLQMGGMGSMPSMVSSTYENLENQLKTIPGEREKYDAEAKKLGDILIPSIKTGIKNLEGKFTTKNGELDYSAIGKASSMLSQQLGAGDFVKEQIRQQIINQEEYSKVKPAVNQFANQVWKKMTGKTVDEFVGEKNQAVKDFILQKQVLEQNFQKTQVTLNKEYTAKSEQINERYKAILSQAKNEEEQSQIASSYITEMNGLASQYNSRINRVKKEVDDELKSKISKAELSDETKKQLDVVYNQAYKYVTKANLDKKQREQDELYGKNWYNQLLPYNPYTDWEKAKKTFFAPKFMALGWKSATGAMFNGVSNLGNGLVGLGLGGGFTDFLRGQQQTADKLETIDVELKGMNWLKPNTFATRLGKQIGFQAPIIAATAFTKNPFMAGTIGFGVEQVQNAGEVYNTMMQQYDDPIKAQNAAKNYLTKNLPTLPLYFLESEMMLRFAKAKPGVLKNLAAENLNEVTQELIQGYTQQQEYKNAKSLGTFLKEDAPNIALETALTTTLQSGLFAAGGKIMKKLGTDVEYAQKSHLYNLVSTKGLNAAFGVLELKANNNLISPEEMAAQKEKLTKLNNDIFTLKDNGLTDVQVGVYLGFAAKLDAIREKQAKATNPQITQSYQKEIESIEKKIQDAVMGKLDGVSVTLPSGSTMTLEGNGEDILSELKDEIATGQADITSTDDKVNQKVEELKQKSPPPVPDEALEQVQNEVGEIEDNFQQSGYSIDFVNDSVVISDLDGNIIGIEDIPADLQQQAVRYEDLAIPKAEEEKPTEVKAEPTKTLTNKEKVEQLRAEEQAEYDAMPNQKDEVKKKEIYDRYDKLITPLLESETTAKENNLALKDETPIISTPKKLSTSGLPDLDIVESKEANEALESEIGGDKGIIDKNIRTIPIQEYDVPANRRRKQIAEQIEENGWIEPLIVSYDKNGQVYIVEGQHRAAALKELGYDKAPVIVIHEKDLGKQSLPKKETKPTPLLEAEKKEQPKQEIKIAEDESENKYANDKLTEKDNIEQEPSIKAIESKAESNNKAELNEVVKQVDEKLNAATDVRVVPLSSITTDESRFQNRQELDQQKLNDIAENWKDADQDPIHVWTDPKNGKTYVLSGHHRFYGAKKAGRENVKIVDRTNDFTETQAIKFAKEEANANRTMETPLERAKALREKTKRGDSKQEINKFLEREGKNKSFVQNLAALNPLGKVMQMLGQFGNAEDRQTQKETEQRADWIGEARRTIAGLTDAHENEMFDFLFDKDASKRITTKADFLQKVRSVVKPLEPDVPLNIARFKNKTQGEAAYDEAVNEKKAEIAEKQEKINEINDRFSNPQNPNYISTENKEYASARSIADNKISQLESERKLLQKQLEDIYREKGKYTGAATSGSATAPESTISKPSFDALIERISKAFPKVKFFYDEGTFNEKMKKYGNGNLMRTPNGTIYGATFPDGSVYINQKVLSAETPIHEASHIWEALFPKEWKNGVELFRQSKGFQKALQEVQNNKAYKNKTLQEQESEALNTLIGRKGEGYFQNELLSKFKAWLQKFFNYIGQKFGVKLSPDTKLNQFVNEVIGDILGGKPLTQEIVPAKGMMKINGENVNVKQVDVDVVNGFYSPLEKIISESKFDKLPAKQWAEKFAKGEEAKWTGLADWLSQQQGSVSKADIQQYLKDNRIQVVEVVKGGDIKGKLKKIADKHNLRLDFGEEGELDIVDNEDGEVYRRKDVKTLRDVTQIVELNLMSEEKALAIKEIFDLNEPYAYADIPNEVKFGNYQLEGEKENYKEVLVTMPMNNESVFQNLADKYNTQWSKISKAARLGDAETLKEIGLNDSEIKSISKNNIEQFKSSHFDEPNILVHLRMNTRKDSQGNKVLFLEEIQSDWGQTGKKEGFKGENKRIKELADILKENPTNTEAYNELQQLVNSTSKEQVPSAPFVTDTNAWTKLGLKVALKEAVKQGVDKIAWTTGEQQNERYDLSKQLKQVEWNRYTERGAVKLVTLTPITGNVIELPIDENGFVSKNVGTQFDGQRIDNVIGKEIGDKIVSENSGDLSGDGLKVGGKGMKGFYGSPSENNLGIVGNVAKSLFKQEPKTLNINVNKYLSKQEAEKRFKKGETLFVETKDKGEYEVVSLIDVDDAFDNGNRIFSDSDLSKGSNQQSIDITPELRAQVEKGQPMFMAKGSKIFEDYDKYNALKNSEKVKNPQIVEQLKSKYGQELNKVKDITLNFDKYTTQLLNSGYIKDKIC
jgi:ParB-like chromosome segregation protein Spo0J